MSNHVWRVFTYELRRNFRRVGYQFTTFGLPIIAFVLFFGYRYISNANAQNAPASTDVAGQTTPAADNNTPDVGSIRKAGYVDLSGMFPTSGDTSGFITRYSDETAATAALNAGQIDVYYVIPADYAQTGNVTLVMPHLSLGEINGTPIREVILAQLSKGMDKNLFQRLLYPAAIKEINLSRDASGKTASDFGSDFTVVYLFAIVLMISVFMTNGYLMQTVVEEKETRLIEILISTVRPTQLLAGKILALGFLGLMQIIVWFAAIILLGRLAVEGNTPTLAALGNIVPEPGKIAFLLVYFALGYLFFAGGYGMIGAISNSMQEGPQYAVVFTLPAALPLYFLSIFITAPDGTLATILSLFPLTAPLSMVMRVSITTVPAWQIIVSLVLLAITDVVMIWLAGRLFRVNNLLAGQVPKLKDIPKLIRG